MFFYNFRIILVNKNKFMRFNGVNDSDGILLLLKFIYYDNLVYGKL